MKTVKILLCAALWSVGSWCAVSAASAAEPSAYERAVAEYVVAATDHTKALHEQVKALRPEGEEKVDPARKDVERSLARLDEAVKALAKSEAKDFDTLKGRYEKERAAVVAKIAELPAF